MRRPVVVVLAVILSGFAVGCGAPETETPTPEGVEGTVPQETGEAGETGETGGAGEQPQGDPEAGKEVYASAGCGSCHVFAAAGSEGTVGPNLDESKPSYEESLEQITEGGGGMPAFKDQLSEEEIANVAAFVTESAGG